MQGLGAAENTHANSSAHDGLSDVEYALQLRTIQQTPGQRDFTFGPLRRLSVFDCFVIGAVVVIFVRVPNQRMRMLIICNKI